MAFDHRAGDAGRAPTEDFRRHLGHAYVPRDDAGEFTVLDAGRRAALEAWTETVIAGDEHWPSARDVGAAAYIDAIVARAPRVRPVLLRGLAAVERAAEAAHGGGFAECDPDAREHLLREFSAIDDTGAFELVLELTFEAYYRDPEVCRVMERRTGFRAELPHTGSEMEPFDESLLERVKALPAHYREVTP